MSPTTPPPNANNTVLRSQLFSSKASKISCSVGQSLCASPSGRLTSNTLANRLLSAACNCAAYKGATAVLETISAVLARGKPS